MIRNNYLIFFSLISMKNWRIEQIGTIHLFFCRCSLIQLHQWIPVNAILNFYLYLVFSTVSQSILPKSSPLSTSVCMRFVCANDERENSFASSLFLSNFHRQSICAHGSRIPKYINDRCNKKFVCIYYHYCRCDCGSNTT